MTVEARVTDPGAAPVLAAIAALWGPLERLLFKQLFTGGDGPTLARI